MGGCISAELKRSITKHFDELLGRANDHREGHEKRSSILTVLYERSRTSAVRAFDGGAYHQALEFARAAEALAHVRQDGQRKLESSAGKLQLNVP